MINNEDGKKSLFTRKISTWIVILALILVVTVGAQIGKMTNGKNEIILSKSVTVKEIVFVGSMNDDDSSTFAIAEDGLSFIISTQVNNNDWYEYWVILWNDANRDVDVHIKCPLNKDFLTKDNIKVDLDCQHYGLRISPQEWAFTVATKNTAIISMNISIDSAVSPGFYQIPFKITDWTINAKIENSERPNTNPADYDGDGIPNYQEVGYGKDGTKGVGGVEANPFDGDADNDGLLYMSEDFNLNGIVDATETDPNNPDTDGDGLNDGLERGLSIPEGKGTSKTWHNDIDPSTKTDPLDADSDNDGLKDGQEDKNENGKVDSKETNPIDTDTDDDNVQDGMEDSDLDTIIDPTETNPYDFDTDNDGLPDGLEKGIIGQQGPSGFSDGANKGYRVIFLGTDTSSINYIVDTDPSTTTNPLDDDSDDDGLVDGIISVGEDKNKNGFKDSDETDPNTFDTDNDGLGDGQERGLMVGEGTGTKSAPFIPDSFSLTITDPLDDDTDDDNIKDGDEDINHDGHIEGDINLNFIWDIDEIWLETDPNDADTDDDTYGDGEEIIYEFDPLNASDPSFDLPKGELEFHKEQVIFEYTLFDFRDDNAIFLGLDNLDNPWGLEVPLKIPFGIPWILALWFSLKAGFELLVKIGLEIQAYCKLTFIYNRCSWFNPNDVTEDGSFNYVSKMELDRSYIEFLFSLQPFFYIGTNLKLAGSIDYEVLGISGTLVSFDEETELGIGAKDGFGKIIDIDFTGDNKLDTTKFTEILGGDVLGINLFSPVGTLIQTPPLGLSFTDFLPDIRWSFPPDTEFPGFGISMPFGLFVDVIPYCEAGIFFEIVSYLMEETKAVIDSVPEEILFEEENKYYELGEVLYREIEIPDSMSGKNVTITTENFRNVISPLLRYYYKLGLGADFGVFVEIPDIEINLFLFSITIPLPDIGMEKAWSLPDWFILQEGQQDNPDSWGRVELFKIMNKECENKPIITETTEIHDKIGTEHSHEYDVSTYGQNLIQELDFDKSVNWGIAGVDFALKYGLDLGPHLDLNSKLHTHCEDDTETSRDTYKYVVSMDSDDADDGRFWIETYFYVALEMDLPGFPNPFAFLNSIDFLGILPDIPEEIDIPPIELFNLSSEDMDIPHYYSIDKSKTIPIIPNIVDLEFAFGFFVTDGHEDSDEPITIEENVLTAPGRWETSPIIHFYVTCQLKILSGLVWVHLGDFNGDLILKAKGFYRGDLTFTEESDVWPDTTIKGITFDNPGDYYSCEIYPHFIEGPKQGRSNDDFTARLHNFEYELEELVLTTRFTGKVLIMMHPIKLNKDVEIWDIAKLGILDPLPLKDVFDDNSVEIPPFP